LKSEKFLAGLTRDFPERAKWWEDMEALAGGTFRKEYSRSELRDFVDRQGDWIFDDENGALCQQDGGECIG